MKTYAIMGATGQVGGAVARQLLKHGADVRAIVRTEAAATAWRARGAESVIATLDDTAALQRAFTAVDGVFLMTSTWFEQADMFAENLAAITSLGAALRAARVEKAVLLSSIGAQLRTGTGAIGKMYLMEQALADLPGLTALRPAWFMENYAGMLAPARTSGVLASMLAPLECAIPMVATSDIGAVAAQRLLDDWTGQHVIELAGPRSYSPVDVAAAMASVLQRPVAAQALPASAWLAVFASWGLTPIASSGMAAMTAGFNNGHIRFSQAPDRIVHGSTTLESVFATLAPN
jgi:uncharacterized protein YbjT (DUF2867 family)